MYTDVLDLLGFCLLGAVVSMLFVRELTYHYWRFETNHDTEDEGLGTKVALLWRYNTIIATFGVAITLLYSIFISNVIEQRNLETLAVVAVLFATGNITVRLASYGYVNQNEKGFRFGSDTIEEIKTRIHEAAYSFVIGLWFLLFIGIGLTVYNDTGISGQVYPNASITAGIKLGIGVLGATFLLAIISELLLWVWPLQVPERVVD